MNRPTWNVLLATGALAALTACGSPTVTPRTTTAATGTPTAAPTQTGTVAKIVDGDTFHVQTDGTDTTIRVLAMDTPETVDPRRPDGCFGKEASDHAKQVLGGKTVTLTIDPTQDNHDRYGRSLRYVTVDGKDFGQLMIDEGFAHAYKLSSGPAPQRYAEYLKAEHAARDAGRGLWAVCPPRTSTTS